MLAAMQENTQYRPSADNALMRWIVRHAAWLIPRFRGSEAQSPYYRAMDGPYRGKLVEFGETVLAHLPEVGKGSGNPAPKLADRWKSGVWLGKSDLSDEQQTMELCMREVYDDSQRTFGQKREPQGSHRDPTEAEVDDNRRCSRSQSHQKCMNMSQNEEANENDDEDRETPDKPDDEDHEMEGDTLPEPDIVATSSSSRGKKRTETQEKVFVKRRLMAKSPKRPITSVPPPEDPVKRR